MKESRKAKNKVKKVLGEFKAGTLHSGSEKGPLIKNKRQAMAVAMSESGLSRRKK
jgi:hypothetical protein